MSFLVSFFFFFERAKYAQMINLYSSLNLFKWYVVYLSVFRPAKPDEIYPVVLTEVRKEWVMSLEFLRSYAGWQGSRAPLWKRRRRGNWGTTDESNFW